MSKTDLTIRYRLPKEFIELSIKTMRADISHGVNLDDWLGIRAYDREEDALGIFNKTPIDIAIENFIYLES